MAMAEAAARNYWLADMAVQTGLLKNGAAITLPPGTPLVDAWASVSRACGLSEQDLARHVAARYRLGVADLSAPASAVDSLVPEKVARRYTAFPVRASDRQITVAVGDPTDFDLEQALGFASGRVPVFEIAPPADIV